MEAPNPLNIGPNQKMHNTREMLNMFMFFGLTDAQTSEIRGWNFEKCLKQGKCSICSIFWGLTGAKTPENRGWNFEKCLKQAIFPLRIEHIERFPCFKHYFWNIPPY